MNKKLTVLSLALTGFILVHAQKPDQIINVQDVSRIEKALSADDMEGRKIFTPGIEKAASFIASEFAKTGLGYLDGLEGYRQEFGMIQQKSIEISGDIDGKPLDPQWVAALGTEAELTVNEQSGFNQVYIDSLPNLFRGLSSILNSGKPTVVWLSEKNKNSFRQLSFFSRRPMMEGAVPVIFVLHEKPEKFSIAIKRKIEKQPLTNIVGVIPGKSKKDEYVVFSAHYDHLGYGKPDAKGDSLYNGANDDASGTTAVIMLAKYFKALNDNERTLIFVAFTAEESGGYGSRYFSQQLNPDKVVAMFNIEMIGTDSKWGTNSAYITGYEKTDFGQILQKNLEGSKFRFEPDPYPEQNLFMRSDNATLAALGVPAHTISTSKMDNEPHYHKQSDEFETLDMNNMTEVIKGIALSSKSIISGKDTPTRVKQD
ncbi:MAG: M20/M25/M40 family metallo-hydrolase [Chitinophagaceae bacterium]|nr:M20/M25/M40 family metallo-hydrolase [Chitinophagaceae bacterium]MCZ2397204.1 M20/M25/M40 family metallo-hydrolase [Chitinophagales bacterium]